MAAIKIQDYLQFVINYRSLAVLSALAIAKIGFNRNRHRQIGIAVVINSADLYHSIATV
jgi:hypothetical protein